SSPFVRAWSIQLALEDRELTRKVLDVMEDLARDDKSPVVRLYLASAMQRFPLLTQRWDLLGRLLRHAEDATDQNLVLMYWYALEPLADVDAEQALNWAMDAKIPQILPFMVRRIGSSGSPEALERLVAALAKTDSAQTQSTFLRGISDALKGRRQV